MCVRNCNEYSLNPLTRINWRTSLVPAPAVIPAPIAYIKVVVVKKLVVGSQFTFGGLSHCVFTVKLNTLPRSEEHTSELQSRFDLVCRLLLEKKKRKK